MRVRPGATLLIKERAERARPGSEVQGVCGCGHCGQTEAPTVSWATVFRLRQFARGSLWVLPLAGVLLGVTEIREYGCT